MKQVMPQEFMTVPVSKCGKRRRTDTTLLEPGRWAVLDNSAGKGQTATVIRAGCAPLWVHWQADVVSGHGCGPGRSQLVAVRCSRSGGAWMEVLNTYVPNSGVGKPALAKLPQRKVWDAAVAKVLHVRRLAGAAVMWVGDLNVISDSKMDLWHGKSTRYAGNTVEERNGFHVACAMGNLTDLWRAQHPRDRSFTFFTKRRGQDFHAMLRSKNKGWRLDYILGNATLQRKWSTVSTTIKTPTQWAGLACSDHDAVQAVLARTHGTGTSLQSFFV